MKKLIFIIILSTIISCDKDTNDTNGILEPTQIQRALVVETTGTWCSACPYGAELLMLAEHMYTSTLPVAVHSGDALSTPTSDAFDVNFPTSGVPNFYVGNDNVGQSPNGAISAMELKIPTAGVGHEWEKVGTSYEVTSRVKFYSADNGEFYVGCYFIQDPIDACGSLTQAGMDYVENGCTTYDQSSNMIDAYQDENGEWQGVYLINEGDVYKHSHVIGGHAGNSVWGSTIVASSLLSGEFYDFQFTIEEGYGWTANGHILTILWEKQGNTYNFVNGYMK